MRWKEFWKNRKAVFSILGIAVFWFFMMYQLVRAEYYPDGSNVMESNYRQTLADLKTEQKTTMGIYYGITPRTKIGYMQTTLHPREDGTFDVDTNCRFSLPITTMFLWDQLKSLFNAQKESIKKFEILLKSNVYVGPDFQIKEIALFLKSSFLDLACQGKIRGNKLSLDILKNGEKVSQTFSIPVGTMVSNPIGFSGKYPKLSVGKQIKTRWFDPITQSFRTTDSVVKGRADFSWHGNKIPVYIIQTSFSGLKTTSWVDEKGEIYQYQFSFLTFIREPQDKKISMD
ncbi:MAG: hypothetical protein HUU50_06455 [Candidatus Brocadiae bacterium]|nr:hypothetical protein [Candidatus Brocadiia bacterium]